MWESASPLKSSLFPYFIPSQASFPHLWLPFFFSPKIKYILIIDDSMSANPSKLYHSLREESSPLFLFLTHQIFSSSVSPFFFNGKGWNKKRLICYMTWLWPIKELGIFLSVIGWLDYVTLLLDMRAPCIDGHCLQLFFFKPFILQLNYIESWAVNYPA